MRVIVQGRLKSRQYETREGEKRTVFEIDVEEVGPSLKSATAKVARATRAPGGGGGGFAGGGGGNQPAGGGFGGAQPQGGAPANDPWATPAAPAQQGGGGWGGQPQGGAPANDPWAAPGVSQDEPPF
jgi:single-strand DNA-binding protein